LQSKRYWPLKQKLLMWTKILIATPFPRDPPDMTTMEVDCSAT
jgi:hypothetical protein